MCMHLFFNQIFLHTVFAGDQFGCGYLLMLLKSVALTSWALPNWCYTAVRMSSSSLPRYGMESRRKC